MTEVIKSMSGEIPYQQLREVYFAAYERRDPCDLCGKQHPTHHHATVFGQNLCNDCYQLYEPCTQLYPGDQGYPPFFGNIK